MMRVHLPGPEHEVMDPAPALYTIRINGHLGAMVLSAFPAMMPPIEGAVAPALRAAARLRRVNRLATR